MTALDLTDAEEGAVKRALTGVAESLEMDAVRRTVRCGIDEHVREIREEIAVLEGVAGRLAGDQSPALSRARVDEAGAARREVSHRYTSGGKR